VVALNTHLGTLGGAAHGRDAAALLDMDCRDRNSRGVTCTSLTAPGQIAAPSAVIEMSGIIQNVSLASHPTKGVDRE
jgi:hypothetical protein